MKTTKALMESSNHIFVLGIDLGKTYMQHAVLIVEDLRSGQADSGIVDENKFQNYEVYIGDNSDWTKNLKCPGGPFMTLDDPDSL